MMELSVIENDHSEVRKYLENFVPDNYYRVLGDAYLYQVRAVLLHAVRNPGEYNARYDALINSLTAQFEDSRVSIGSQISAWADKQGVHAQRLTYLEAENSTVQSSITELEKAVIDVNKVYLEKTNKLEAQIKDFEVGGVNLIHNSTFDKGYEAIGDVSVSTSDYVLGTMYKCENIGDTESVFGIGATEEFYKIKLMEGKKYTLSFYGYGDVNSINQIKLIKGDLVHVLDPVAMGNDITDRRVITFNAPFSGDDIGFSIGTSGFVNGSWFTVVAIQLELGGRATDWAPSPFDDADYIARVSASLEEFRSITLGLQEATVQALDTLRANIGKNAGEIKNEREVNLQRNETTVRQLDELTALSNGNLSKITNLDTATSTRFEANAKKLIELEASVGASNAAIKRLDNVSSTNTSAIASTSSSLTAKIDGLEIGGRNLIRNSTFKLGHIPWGNVDITRTDTVLGSEIEAISTAAGQFGIQNDSLFHTISLVEGKEYTLSMYANGNIDSLNSIWLQSEGNEPQLLPPIPLTETLADKQSVTFVSSMTADNVSLIVAAAGYPVGSWFKFIALQLEKGNKATDWTEAPEDILNYITEASASIDEFKEAQVDFNEATTTSLSNMQSTIGENSSAITSNYNTLSNKNESLVNRLDTYSASYEANKVKVANDIKLVSDANATTASKLDSLETNYEENKTSVTNSINSISTKNVALTESVSSINTQVAGNTTAISNEITARVDGFKAVNETLSTLTSNFDNNKANVSKELETLADKDKAIVKDIDSLNTKTDSANTEIVTMKTAVANNKQSIANTKTELKAEFDNLEIGGRNLLKYSNFEDGSKKYGIGGGTNYIATRDGIKYLVSKFTEDRPHNFFISTQGIATFDIVEGQTYTLSFLGQSSPNCLFDYTWIIYPNETNQRIPVYVGYGRGNRRTVTFVAEKSAPDAYLYIGIDHKLGNTPKKDDWFEIANVKLEKGHKATDWTIAPEEMDEVINASISSEATARANADNSITRRIDTFTSGFGDKSLATIINEVKTYADNDKASASSLNTLTANFNNMEVGGHNLLPNTIFNHDTLDSYAYARYFLFDDKTETGAIRCDSTGTDNDPFGFIFTGTSSKRIKLRANVEYTLSFYGQATVNSMNYCYIMRPDKPTNIQLPSFPIGGGYNTLRSVTFTLDENVEGAYLLVGARGKSGDWFNLNSLTLQRGNKPTAWTISPLDTDAAIAANDARITAEAKVAADANKATAGELKTVKSNVGDNAAAIQTVSNAVSTNKSAIASTKTILEAKIDNQVIGGDNLIPDSEYKKGVYGWGDPSIYTGHSDGYETGYIRATCRTANDAFGIIPHGTTHKLRLLAGEEYTLSFFGQATFQTMNYIYLISSSKPNQFLGYISMGSGMRNKKSLTFTADNDINDGYVLLAARGQPVGAWFAVGGVQLQKGNVATTWQPSASALSSSLEETREVVAGVSAQWSIKLNVGNKVSGIFQSSTNTTSDFEIVTDNFKLSTGTSTGISPFRSEGTKVYINDATIKNGSIGTAKIENGAITTAKIGNLQVDYANIKDGAVGRLKIANLAVDTAQIANGAIETAKIGNAAVKSAQIDDLAVTSGKIANLAVDTLQVADNAITVPRHIYNSNTLSGIQGGNVTKEVCRATIDVQGGAASITLSVDKAHARASGVSQSRKARVSLSVSVLGGETLKSYTVAESTGADVENNYITLPPILDSGRRGNVTYVVTMYAYSFTNSDNITSVTGVTLQILGVKK